jgi:hypothetical protein
MLDLALLQGLAEWGTGPQWLTGGGIASAGLYLLSHAVRIGAEVATKVQAARHGPNGNGTAKRLERLDERVNGICDRVDELGERTERSVAEVRASVSKVHERIDRLYVPPGRGTP